MKHYPGYIALTAVLILSSILLLVSLSYSYVTILRRLSFQDGALKVKTRLAAEACVEEARLKLALDTNYVGNEIISIPIGSESISCFIFTVTTSGPNKIISVQGTVSSSTNRPVTNLVLTVNSTTLEQVSRQEVVDL